MTFYDRFAQLCAEEGLMPQSKEAQKIAGISSPAISNWNVKNNQGVEVKPSADVLCRLSEHFHVTTDYLLGLSELRNPAPPMTITEEERLLLEAYRTATVQGRFNIIQVCMNEKGKGAAVGVAG